MGDLIDRQATVDALMEQFKRNTTTAIRAKLTVEGVPSAQPEPQWIPCSEQLPVEGIVLVTYRDRDIDILRYPTAYRQYDIIAWMPIEPWRGEDE